MMRPSGYNKTLINELIVLISISFRAATVSHTSASVVFHAWNRLSCSLFLVKGGQLNGILTVNPAASLPPLVLIIFSAFGSASPDPPPHVQTAKIYVDSIPSNLNRNLLTID